MFAWRQEPTSRRGREARMVRPCVSYRAIGFHGKRHIMFATRHVRSADGPMHASLALEEDAGCSRQPASHASKSFHWRI